MSWRSLNRRTSDKGAVMAEFALILPVLLILTFGIIEFGRAYNTTVSLQGAAREAARALALCKTTSCASESAVRTVVSRSAPVSPTSVEITDCLTARNGVRSTFADVTLRTTTRLAIPFFSVPLTLSGKASMRCGL